MTTDVLKEFLVKLGFKVDDTTYKKMNDAVGSVTKAINELGISTEISLASLTAFTAKAGAALDSLYFMSQRTGATVSEINSFSYAIAQSGGSVEGAKSSIESLTNFINTYPGAKNLLERWGVKPENVNDAVASLGDLRKILHDTDIQHAKLIASKIGMDDVTLRAFRSNDYKTYLDQYIQKLKDVGLSEQDAANKGHQLGTAFRNLEADSQIAGEALVNGGFGKALIWITNYLDRAARGLAIFSRSPSEGLHNAAVNLGLAKDTGPQYEAVSPTNALSLFRSGSGALGERQNNPGNLRSWGNNPVVNGFAAFPNPLAGLSAEAAQLIKYGDRGWNSLAAIVSHWAPAGDHNNVPAYISALEKSTGFGPNQSLNLRDPATLERIMHGINTHEQGRDVFGKGLYDTAVATRTGASVNMTVTNNIHGGDAQAISSAVNKSMNTAAITLRNTLNPSHPS